MADWNREIHNAAQNAEDELRRLIDYLNDEVVPDVRRHGSVALRSAADRLQALATKLDDQRRGDGPR
jgi:hypothetical protein